MDRKLANPKLKLNEDESQRVLLVCIKQGAEAAAQALGKEAIIFIGNTGAGKSTAINYVHSCTLTRKGKVWVVDDDSPVPELMPVSYL